MIQTESTAAVEIDFGIRPATQTESVRLYLELMKRCLTNTVHDAPDLMPLAPRSVMKRLLVSAFRSRGIALARVKPPEDRARGLDRHPPAETMIGLERLNNIQRGVEQVLTDGVPGGRIA